MSSFAVLHYDHLGQYNPQILEDVLRLRGTVNSQGYRWSIVIESSQAMMLIIKYPQLQLVNHSNSTTASFTDITVQIA